MFPASELNSLLLQCALFYDTGMKLGLSRKENTNIKQVCLSSGYWGEYKYLDLRDHKVTGGWRKLLNNELHNC
jgi:hypothetical protein